MLLQCFHEKEFRSVIKLQLSAEVILHYQKALFRWELFLLVSLLLS